MNGILYIDKPKGMTSFDVCHKLRKVFGIRKIGHTGTLDPNATGVLIVLLGSAAKCTQFLSSDRKTYNAEVLLGIDTDTLDIDGKIVEEREAAQYDPEKLREVLKSYLGKSLQLPPMTSAIKVNGKKLYEYQREGKEVEVKERPIEVFSIELLSASEDSFCFRTEVSGGTYIRALMRDILKDMGLIGTLKELRREAVDEIDLSECDKLEDVLSGRYHIHSPYELLSTRYETVEVSDARDVLNGKPLSLETESDTVLLVREKEALAVYHREGDVFRCVRGLL